MNCVRTCRRACAPPASDVAHFHSPFSQSFQARPHEVPSAHVLRFFLRPDDLSGLCVGVQPLLQQCSWERVELFEPQNSDAAIAALLMLRSQIVIDLTAAHDHSRDVARGYRVAYDRIETALCEVIERG